MKKASDHFNQQQREAINAAVDAAESHTIAEIVPVVATASGRYERSEDIVGLWLGAMALAAVWAWMPESTMAAGDWSGISSGWKLFAMLVALVGGFMIGAVVADKVLPLRRLFTPASQMRDEVTARARQVFFDSTVHHTAGATGLLIYISLYERQAVLLADKQIIDKIGQPTLDEMCDTLTARLRETSIADAMIQTIELAGEKLSEVMPGQTNNPNELCNALVVVDQVAV